MINSAGSKVWPSWRPWPETRTRLASPISDWLITTGMGLLATCWPFFFTCTRCSPVSLGTNEMPGHGEGLSAGERRAPTPSLPPFQKAPLPSLLPTRPLRSRFSRQGSSRPEGGTTVAVSRLRSVSEMLMGMSAAEPTFRWDMRIESSPGRGRSLCVQAQRETAPTLPPAPFCHRSGCHLPVTLAVKGLPGMCCSLYLTRML